VREAYVPFAFCSVETLERHHNALARLQPLENGAGEQFRGAFLDFAFRDPARKQLSYPSGYERRRTLFNNSRGELRGLRRFGPDDDNKAPGRVAQPMRRSEDARPD
jgi:hypothetical protein